MLKNRTTIILAFAALAISRCVFAAQDTSAQRVDSLFSQYNSADSPGLVVAVVRDGKVL
jgi:hypothetical protein